MNWQAITSRRELWISLLALLLIALLLPVYIAAEPTRIKAAELQILQSNLDEAMTLYAQNCAVCHGMAGDDFRQLGIVHACQAGRVQRRVSADPFARHAVAHRAVLRVERHRFVQVALQDLQLGGLDPRRLRGDVDRQQQRDQQQRQQADPKFTTGSDRLPVHGYTTCAAAKRSRCCGRLVSTVITPSCTATGKRSSARGAGGAVTWPVASYSALWHGQTNFCCAASHGTEQPRWVQR
jgi:hypothetical protein